MPTYRYECATCEDELEIHSSIHEPKPRYHLCGEAKACGRGAMRKCGPIRQVFTVPAIDTASLSGTKPHSH